MPTAQQYYDRLHKIAREAAILQGVSSLIEWDQETYMPSAAAGVRGEQVKLLAGLIHKQRVSKPFVNTLSKLIDIKSGKLIGKGLSEAQQAAVRVWRRDYLLDQALPQKFVEEQAQLNSHSMLAWRNAKHQNAFHQFAPFLEKIIAQARKKAEYLGYKDHPYDALLDLYEPGITTKEVKALFTPLRTSVTKLLKKITATQKAKDDFLFGNFPKEQQVKFGHLLLKAMGFNEERGRLDTSEHPFSSSSHPTDNRITTHIHTDSLMANIGAVLHETGHGLYSMGLSEEHFGSPLGEAISLGVHESQSRWWETLIGQSKPFWKYFYPKLQQQFKGLQSVSLDAFYKAINKVQPSLIRIEADEVTYSLHVILRFELEVALIEGSLPVRELPEAWNAKMKELLGVIPETNSQGCLQDIHWSMGALGYFPTYTLGNLYGAHLFQGFLRDHPDWEKRVAKGELIFIKDWLHQNVYQHGRRYSSKELLLKATGKPFSADAYVHYLTKKYT